MTAVYITLFFIVLIALAVSALVAMGLQGAWKDRAPRLASGMAEAARHLNGDAEPPRALVDLMPSQLTGSKN